MAVGLLTAAAYVPDWVSRSPRPAPTATTPVGDDSAERASARSQAALVSNEDERLIAQLRAVPRGTAPYLDRSRGTVTAVLPARVAPYELADLIKLDAAERVEPGTVDLLASVFVAPGARLVLDAPDTVLRMISNPAGFTSIVGSRGSVELTGEPGKPLTILTWDPATEGPDRNPVDGRSYIRVDSAPLRTNFVDLADLGFWSGRTGGLAVTGSDTATGSGAIADTSVVRSHYGLFSSDTARLTVARSRFDANAADGVLLHRGTTGATVATSTARFNAGQGMAADQGSSASTFSEVVTESNAGAGVMLDGRPLAARSGPSGASLDSYRGFRVENSTSGANQAAGIVARGTVDTAIINNQVTSTGDGVVVQGAARAVAVSGNQVTAADTGVAVRDGGTEVLVAENTVLGAGTGVQVRNAEVGVRANTIDDARAHGVSVQGAANGSAVTDNSLAGRGLSALDLYRLDTGAAVTVLGNDEQQWQITRSLGQQVTGLIRDHPLLLMWMLVLLIPVVSLLGRRRRRRPTSPYPAHHHPPDPSRLPPATGRPTPQPDTTGSGPHGSGTRVTVVSGR